MTKLGGRLMGKIGGDVMGSGPPHRAATKEEIDMANLRLAVDQSQPRRLLPRLQAR